MFAFAHVALPLVFNPSWQLPLNHFSTLKIGVLQAKLIVGLFEVLTLINTFDCKLYEISSAIKPRDKDR